MPLSNKPLYLQVRDALVDLISRGAWKPGFQLPSEGELAREVGVSSGTVRKALELMERQGLIQRRQGRGSFVSNPTPDELVGRYGRICGTDGVRLHGEQAKVVSFGRHEASSLDCRRLRLQVGAEVYRARRVREHRDERILLEDVVLPVNLFPGPLDGAAMALEIGLLAHQNGIHLGKAEERITVGIPPRDVAEQLRIAPFKETMRLDRVVMTLNGSPVEWRIAYWQTDRLCYLAEIK
jgi:GntR family transcriptional regulator